MSQPNKRRFHVTVATDDVVTRFLCDEVKLLGGALILLGAVGKYDVTREVHDAYNFDMANVVAVEIVVDDR